MQLWLSKESDVPVREQLKAQIKLAILSRDLKPGQKLPSTRELARRFRIHPNTVSAAYRELADQGWVDLRAGSGIYVRSFKSAVTLESQLDLDGLIIEFLQLARHKGFSLAEVQARIRHWMRLQPPDHFLVIDPDQEFRSILITELRAALNFRVEGASPQECAGRRSILLGSIPVALYAQAEAVTAALPDKMSCMLLHTRSVPETLKDEKMPAKDDLIIIASRWPAFLQYAHSMLGALKIDPDSLSFRDAREADWRKGLRAGTFVIADAATAEQIPPGVRVRVFSIIADSSLAEMRHYVEKFLKTKNC